MSIELWQLTREHADRSVVGAMVSHEDFERLIASVESPSDLKLLTRMIYSYAKENPTNQDFTELLFEACDQSSYGLEEWVQALLVFQKWLDEKGMRGEILDMLEYMECCQASPESNVLQSGFTDLVLFMLETAGFERGRKNLV